jgi:N utilization substance protein A
MVEVKLTEDSMRLISQFESLTGAGSRDCVLDERNARLIFVVNPGDMGLAIGKKGASIKKASEIMGKKIEVVEYNSNVEQFIKNCFLPAQVTSILFEGEPDAQTATVEVRDEDRGIAIGKDGKNIFKAKKLSQRQHNIMDVQILQKPMDGEQGNGQPADEQSHL